MNTLRQFAEVHTQGYACGVLLNIALNRLSFSTFCILLIITTA
jgi:hypothetical protein